MTVTSTQRSVTYTGNGSTTEFPIEFYFETGWIVATFSTVNDSEEVMSEEVVDSGEYTLSGAGEESGGSLTYPLSGEPLSASERLSIERVVPVTQERVFSNTKPYDATQHGAALDKLTMVSQEHGDDLGRCVKVPVGEETDPDDLLLALRQDAAAASAAHDGAVAAHDGAVAAREAAEAAAGKIPDIEAGDADAFLTVKADESGNEYVGGADARAKLGLGEAALEDVVPVAKGGTGTTNAATARANLGLGPAAVEDALVAHRYVYVAQDGSDDTGDGSSWSPYQTVNKALEHLGGLLMTPESYATIRVRGYLENHPTIEVKRNNLGSIAIVGEQAPSTTGYYTNLNSVSGTAPNYSVTFGDGSVVWDDVTAVGEYIIVEGVDATPFDKNIKTVGCWKVTEINGDYVTLAVKDHSGGPQIVNPNMCNLIPMRDGIKFAPGIYGISAIYPGVDIGQIANLVLVGGDGDDPTASNRYGIRLNVGSRTWLNGRVGITGWNTGLMSVNGIVEAGNARISNCQYGAYNEGGIFRAGNIHITGCVYRGFRGQYSTQNMIHGANKVIAGNGTGVYAYYGAFIAAQTGVIAHNGDNFQPNALTIGNAQSYIHA